ncbi:MAG: sporulation integral membrane protein YlbJ [Firmicutes bacterium]|nr:sporulation integral membrane protein YlbJ [Bacillota bacterium]
MPIASNGQIKILWAILAVVFVAIMVSNPQAVFEGASSGVSTWWNIVFPALLPFFIASELLMGFGVVRFMAVLLEPVMRPLFNVPGSGSFVVAVGFTSGYPIGAMVTAKLRSQGLLSRVEAERLVSFTNNSSPLFMLVAVAVGMLKLPALGYLIAASHYLGNLTLGLALRFYKRHDRSQTPPLPWQGNRLRQAFREMLGAINAEQRPTGRIISDAVTNSISKLLNVGGFIILFAVLINLFKHAGIIGLLARLFAVILTPLGFAPATMTALAAGFFEMTIGVREAAHSGATLPAQLMAIAVILAWSGLSIQSQVASMVSGTDINLRLFFLSRIGHAGLSTIYTVLLYPLFNLASSPVSAAPALPPGNLFFHPGYANYLQLSFCTLLGLFIVPLLFYLVYYMYRGIRTMISFRN